MLLEHFFDTVHHGFGMVARLDQLLALLILFGMGLRIMYHAINFVVIEAARSLDADLLLLAGGALAVLQCDPQG